jgi:hypothetical protein
MWKVIWFATLVICQFQSVVARAIPGTHLSGRASGDQHLPRRADKRSVVARDSEKICPKIIIISMVFSASDAFSNLVVCT